MKRWLKAGGGFQSVAFNHDSDWQADRLRATGLEPRKFNEKIAIGLVGLDCFDVMKASKLDIDGYVFVGQKFKVYEQIKLNSDYKITGHVRANKSLRNGLLVEDYYSVHDADNNILAETSLIGLLRHKTKDVPEKTVSSVEFPRRNDIHVDHWEVLKNRNITPDDVRIFSEDVGNDIHFNASFAAQYGFKAPLAQGVMTCTYLMAGIEEAGLKITPDTLYSIRYLRPIFWEDSVSLCVGYDKNNKIIALATKDKNERITADLRLFDLSEKILF